MKHYIFETDGQLLLTSDVFREPPASAGGTRVEIPINMTTEQAQKALSDAPPGGEN